MHSTFSVSWHCIISRTGKPRLAGKPNTLQCLSCFLLIEMSFILSAVHFVEKTQSSRHMKITTNGKPKDELIQGMKCNFKDNDTLEAQQWCLCSAMDIQRKQLNSQSKILETEITVFIKILQWNRQRIKFSPSTSQFILPNTTLPGSCTKHISQSHTEIQHHKLLCHHNRHPHGNLN